MITLIPQPKQITEGNGYFEINPSTRIFIPRNCERPEYLAAKSLQEMIECKAGIHAQLDRLGLQTYDGSTIVLEIAQDKKTTGKEKDGYTLSISQERVTVTGNSASGLFVGIKTLTQLVKMFGELLPVLEIRDEPDFEFRGYYQDVSRGKIPTMKTFRWLIDFLADRKVNQFQLYVEHPFIFRSNPAIAQNKYGLKPEEILELQEYCRDRHIDFVPSFQSFGHMAGVLSLPEYRHLADIEAKKSFREMSWFERQKGLTLDVSNPQALALIEELHDQFVSLFDSPYVNVCSDETYDLGMGKNKERAEQVGKGALYIEHMNHLNDLAKKYGKIMMFWGDIVKHHPDRLGEIPRDAILLNWGYAADADYESTKIFADAGLQFYVCPGCSGWNRPLNDVATADLNIRRYAATGKKYGALGFLNTDWGDNGHFNMISGSLFGAALGAAMGWNVDAPSQKSFDEAWSVDVLGTGDPQFVASLRAQSVGIGTWSVFYAPFEDAKKLEWAKLTAKEGQILIDEGTAGAKRFARLARRGGESAWVADELAFASGMNALLGIKVLLMEAVIANKGERNPKLAKRLRKFAKAVKEYYPRYKKLWLARNRRTELDDIFARMKEVIKESKQIAKALEKK